MGFVQTFHCLTICPCLLDDGFQVHALLVKFGGALIVGSYLKQVPANLFEAIFDAF
jgi:hypothetical protein